MGLNVLANANLNTVSDVERLTPAELRIPTDSDSTLNSTDNSTSSSHISNHFPDPSTNGTFMLYFILKIILFFKLLIILRLSLLVWSLILSIVYF